MYRAPSLVGFTGGWRVPVRLEGGLLGPLSRVFDGCPVCALGTWGKARLLVPSWEGAPQVMGDLDL